MEMLHYSVALIDKLMGMFLKHLSARTWPCKAA